VSVVVDSSAWAELFRGRDVPLLEDALEAGRAVLPPIVVAELVSGCRRPRDLEQVRTVIDDAPLVDTPLEHWVRVGELRAALRSQGVSISTPDAHVAQCALDLGAPLLSFDRIFKIVARHVPLRVPSLDGEL